MSLFSKEHYEIMRMFEQIYGKQYRLDKEDKSLWAKGIIYQHPELNMLFIAFRQGVELGVKNGEN